MEICESTAFVDTDFILHIAGIHKSDIEICCMLKTVLLRLEVFAAVHPLVYENELPKTNTIVNKFFEEEIIAKPTLQEIFKNNQEKTDYYAFVFSTLLSRFSGIHTVYDYETVKSYWKRGQSLGEIHSIAMCIVYNCGLFLSDDSDSKKILAQAQDICLPYLKVYNRKDIISVAQTEGYQLFSSRHERQAFAHSSST